MSDIINKDDAKIKVFMSSVENMLILMEKVADNYRPPLNGLRFMTDSEVSKLLHISRRTLSDYRSSGKLSYYNFGGKVLYCESDIEKTLNDNRQEGWS